jgi:hypothetical protein
MYYVKTRADNSGYANHRPQSVDKRRQLHPSFYLSYSSFLKKYNFSIIMIGIEMKLNIPVH